MLAIGSANVARGADKIRELYADLLASGIRFNVGEQRPPLLSGELALTSTRLPNGTITAEVARRGVLVKKNMLSPAQTSAKPKFWRDDALAYLEVRSIENALGVHYARHAHETFSIGAITAGACTYMNERARQHIGTGSVVLMNPGDVHACNPNGQEQWSYHMLYVDIPWLADIQHDLGVSRDRAYRPFSAIATTKATLYHGLNQLCRLLTDCNVESMQKQEAAFSFMATVQLTLGPATRSERHEPRRIARAAEFIRDNYKQSLKLTDICSAAGLSPSYLIRAFKNEYGLTPHAFLINRRIEFARSQLRRGCSIASVALESGFADQAHLQRAFKRLVAATPGQYRG